MSSRFQPKKRYLVGISVLVLIISVGLNLYNYFVVLPQMQATISNMRMQALNAWLHKMELVKNILKQAETNIDVEDAHVHTSWAQLFVNMFTYRIDISERQKELYYWTSKVTFYLNEALVTVHFGNQTGVVTERYLGKNVLTMIENVTTNIENIESKSSFLRTMPLIGVEPTQQLREVGVLTDVLNYLEQIYQVSIDILDYYK